ncbi:MAG TPA: hypothetical protein H9694_09270 [Firmicutes bacterium]|nr:hypothetical protein [Bacillota bacterium]
MAEEPDFIGSNEGKAKNPPGSFRKTACSFHDFAGLLENEKKEKPSKPACLLDFLAES